MREAEEAGRGQIMQDLADHDRICYFSLNRARVFNGSFSQILKSLNTVAATWRKR